MKDGIIVKETNNHLEKYIEYMKEKHKIQKRLQGTPYYLHPLEVSDILREKGLSEEYQIVGLFHDLLEDTTIKYEDILSLTTKEIADAVKLLTKGKDYDMEKYIDRIKKNDLAKMVKLADRLHNLREAHLASYEFRKKYITETENWYLCLAKDTVLEKDIGEALRLLKEDL